MTRRYFLLRYTAVFFRDANCLAARGAIIKENEHRKLMNQGFLLRYP